MSRRSGGGGSRGPHSRSRTSPPCGAGGGGKGGTASRTGTACRHIVTSTSNPFVCAAKL